MILFVDVVCVMSCYDNVNPEAGSMPLYILHLRACTKINPYENFSPTSLINNMMPFINNHGVLNDE